MSSSSLKRNGAAPDKVEGSSGDPEPQPPAAPSFQRACQDACDWVWSAALKHWFILGVGLAIGLAAAVPNLGRTGGWMKAEWSVRVPAIVIIFLISGLSLQTRVLATALTRLHVHLFIQAISLGLTPVIGYGIGSAMKPTPMAPDLVSGIIIAASMPTTVSTNVVFTRAAGGNEAVALINAVVGNIIGIFITPGLLQVYVGTTSGQGIAYGAVIQNLAVTVIVPLVAGQLILLVAEPRVKWLKAHVEFSVVSNVCILLLVWSTFCNTFYNQVSVDGGSVAVMVIMVILMYLGFTALCLLLSRTPPIMRLLSLDKADAIAVTMCGATKTIALGLPIVSVLFGGQSNAGILVLPLLVYHAVQILAGHLMIDRMKAWVDAGKGGPLGDGMEPEESALKLASAAGGEGESAGLGGEVALVGGGSDEASVVVEVQPLALQAGSAIEESARQDHSARQPV